jgi:IS605 OrfB family transposase
VATEYRYRTAITRLDVPEDQQPLLEATITEWKRGCQIATDLAWDHCHEKRAVQSCAYETVRAETNLGSQHTVLATHHAADAISGCVERAARGKTTSKPQFTAPTIPYDQRSMTLFDDGTVSLATVESRVRCPLVLPEDDDGYQWQYLRDGTWEMTESTLTVEDGTYLLHIGFRQPKTDTEREDAAEDGTVLGVDLGVENIAVTSTARFFPGGSVTHRLRSFENTRRSLQQTGTRSAHRTIQEASGRQKRYLRDVVHCIANGILTEALRYGCDTIVFEDLDHIRTRTDGTWGHVWAFRTLTEFVEYKAESADISVETVSASSTSKQCAECGHTDDRNRPTRDHFACQCCGAEANADYNAAKNIGLRYVRRGQQSSRRTGDGQLALMSGTVTPNGEFSPYPDGFEAESTDKSSSTKTVV